MSKGTPPERRSVRDRLAELKDSPNPLVETDLNLMAVDDPSTTTFSVGTTGELMVDEGAPLAVAVERSEPWGILDPSTASAYHLLLLPADATAEDVEALAVSVWGEAGWLSPGVLRLQENVTLEGPWTFNTQTMRELGVPHGNEQGWLLRCAPRRGAKPSEEVKRFNEWARAFPDGMPVGVEQRVLEVLQRMSRRLHGSLRIAGSGQIVRADVDSSVTLRVLADTWLSPDEIWAVLSPHLNGLTFLSQDGTSGGPESLVVPAGTPYALLAPVSEGSQVLIGVRQETFVPRALRWERWAKAPMVVYEVVWASPEEPTPASKPLPSRRARMERRRAEAVAETAAAAIATAVEHSAVTDEDGFLLALDQPLHTEDS